MGDKPKKPQQKDAGQFSFFQRVFALLFGTDDPEREKRKQLKQIAVELSHQKYKYYKPRSGEALGGLAKFFFEIYRVVGPAQALVQGSENSNALRTILIESFHNEPQKAARERFTDEAIRTAAETLPPDKLVAGIKEAMGAYLAEFDAATVKQINDTYTLIQELIAFVRFDYYFLLRKFDSGVLEGAYTQAPRVDAINAEYISDDLKDFLEVLLPLSHDADWDMALDVLQQYRDVEVIARGPWKKLLSLLSGVVRSGVLVQIIQHVDEDPGFKPMVESERFHIVENHLNVLKTQVEALMQKLSREMRGQRVQKAVVAVFGSACEQRMKRYTEKANAAFTKRMIAGFAHTEPVNYLAVFLLDYFNLDVKLLVSELFIVRAKWSDNTVSSQLSEAFYATLTLAEEIEQFDHALGDDGELGARLRKASGPVKGNDAATPRVLRQVVHDIDERAMNLITESGANLITVGRVIKILIEDYERKSPEIIMNWKEIESLSTESLKGQLVAVYKKIYHFIQLLQMFVKK